MGRYMIIEFDEKEPALKLKKQIDEAARNGRGFRVVGYFARPDEYCVCPKNKTEMKNYQSPKWDRKLGWHICQSCKKPWPAGALKNQLGVEKVINPARYEQPHYKTGLTEEFINHILMLTTVSHIAPKKTKE